MTNETLPKTLQTAIQFFSDEEKCIQFIAMIRWEKGIAQCPKCNAKKTTYMTARRVWLCLECKKQFSVKQGTIFEDSAIPLHKWLAAFWLISNAKNGISSWELHRALGITQKSAWHMGHRVRLALQNGSIEKMGGEGETVEVDETYIGGAARFMHKDRRKKLFHGGGEGKLAVFGLLERHNEKGKSKVKAAAVPRAWRETVNEIIKTTVESGTSIYSDEHGAYSHLNSEGFQHEFVRHAEEYVRGNVHTNGIENFWTLLKRCIRGTHVSVEPFHMFRYLDEEAFRFNERFGNDQTRFMTALSGIVGKRLTLNEVTGKVEAPSADTNTI